MENKGELKIGASEIIIYQNKENDISLNVRLEDENVWLTQANLVDLYQSSKSNVSEHIKHIFEEGELDENVVVRKFRTTTQLKTDMMRIILTLLFFPIIISSCQSSKRIPSYKEIVESYDQYNTYKTIYLDTIYNQSERYIEFENHNAIILLYIKDFLNYANNKLENDSSLCIPKKQYLKNLTDTINYYSTNLYLIQRGITPEEWRKWKWSHPNYKQYKKRFIYPYGYEIKIDTINKVELNTLKDWIISDMCIAGNCLILDKKTNHFANKIYYLITDFKDGHGRESLLFEDKKNFFNVAVYSDIKWPNFDCMSSDEIEEWKMR